MKINKLSQEKVTSFLTYLNVVKLIDIPFFYKIYEYALLAIEQLSAMEGFKMLDDINSYEIIQYCIGEYLYTKVNDASEKDADKKERLQTMMASIIADKYLSLSKFRHDEKTLTNAYLPTTSTLNLYLNFTLNILNKYPKNDPASTLVCDLLTKSLSIAKCSLKLIIDGFYTEAFSSWRTLHECECALILLDRYGEPLIATYLKHMNYGIAFKDGLNDKAKQEAIFQEMKREMQTFNLKSKDIKKYIEYGWMYAIDGVKEDANFKLNFRDGLEKLAGLEKYSKRYEMSSEIIHSTPMLIYSKEEYFYYLTLLSLYESFFRLEKVFMSLFAKYMSPQQMQSYLNMRQVYYAQLVNIHAREANAFKMWQKRQTQGE